MADLVRVAIVRDEMEAEMLCGLLRSGDIKCMQRITNQGYGGGGEVPSSGMGAREVLVNREDLDQARAMVESNRNSSH